MSCICCGDRQKVISLLSFTAKFLSELLPYHLSFLTQTPSTIHSNLTSVPDTPSKLLWTRPPTSWGGSARKETHPHLFHSQQHSPHWAVCSFSSTFLSFSFKSHSPTLLAPPSRAPLLAFPLPSDLQTFGCLRTWPESYSGSFQSNPFLAHSLKYYVYENIFQTKSLSQTFLMNRKLINPPTYLILTLSNILCLKPNRSTPLVPHPSQLQ